MSRCKAIFQFSSVAIALSVFIPAASGQTPQATPAPAQSTSSGAPTPASSTPAPQLYRPAMVPDATGTGVTLARAKESFSEITLKNSVLKPYPPLLGSRERKPQFVRELYQLRWRPNDPLDLYVILPVGVKNPPVVLYLYGFPSETSRFKDDSWCERATHGSVAAVGFVSALTGHRDEHRPITENFITLMPEALATTTHDVQRILDYLATRGDLDMSRVGMFGQGSGGAIAILSAAADPRIKAIDLLDPWGDWPVWLTSAQDVHPGDRANVLKPEFEKSLAALEPLVYLPTLKSVKIRMQFEKDQGEPDAAVDKLKGAAPVGTEVVSFPTARRMYSANSGGRLFAWLGNSLGAPSVAAAIAPDAKSMASSPASPKP